MAMNDPVGDMLTRIRNAQQRRRPKVLTPASTLRGRVLDVLTQEGYIRGYNRVKPEDGHDQFEIELKYYNGQPAIKEIERVSKPGRRVSLTQPDCWRSGAQPDHPISDAAV